MEGPTESTVDNEVTFRVQVVSGDRGTDVTHRAQLVLASGDEELAETRPGGRVFTKSPGKLSVQARLDDLTSAPHELVIRARATELERLELEVARETMKVKESRPYRLWAYPRGGGARQDLTGQVTDAVTETSRPRIVLKVLTSNADMPVAIRSAGSFVAQEPGRFSVQAQLGDRLSTDAIELEVVDSASAPIRLRVEPEQIELLAGQTTPVLKVLVASTGERNYRPLAGGEAKITVSDPGLLKDGEAGQFIAIKPGKATIQVKYKDLEQTVPVEIKINPFAKIDVSRDPKFKDNTMTVELTIVANATDEKLEYRATLPSSAASSVTASDWVLAERDGEQLKAQFFSPKIPLVKGQNEFNLILEARNQKDGSIVRTPFPFKLITGRQKPAEQK